MPEDNTATSEEPRTSRVEHVRIGEGDKLTAKKLPPWGIALIVGGVAIVAYYLYKKHQESSSTTTTEAPATAYSTEGYPTSGYAGGGGYSGTTEQDSSLLSLIQTQEKEQKEQSEKWHTEEKEAREHGETNIQNIVNKFVETMKPTTPEPVATTTTTTPPTETTPTPTTGTGNLFYPERLKEVEENLARERAPAPSPQTNPTQPGEAKVTACPPQFPIRSTRGCYRPIRRNDGAECHEYKGGGLECQHKVGNKWVW